MATSSAITATVIMISTGVNAARANFVKAKPLPFETQLGFQGYKEEMPSACRPPGLLGRRRA